MACDRCKCVNVVNRLKQQHPTTGKCCKGCDYGVRNESGQCLNYIGCGDPCEEPCPACLYWTGYGNLDMKPTPQLENQDT